MAAFLVCMGENIYWLLTTAEQCHSANHDRNTEYRNQPEDQYGGHGHPACCRNGTRCAFWSACTHDNSYTDIDSGLVSRLKPWSILRAHRRHGQYSQGRDKENKYDDSF